MALEIRKSNFDGLGGALKDVAELGLWPTTYVPGAAPAADIHWHDYDVHVYVMRGKTYFVDGESGKRHDVVAGDKIIVPARSLHAEGSVQDEVVYLIALPRPVVPDEFLTPREPALLADA